MNWSIWQAVGRAVRSPAAWLVAVLVFLACAMRNVELPGLYMDAINPDYLVARWFNPALDNTVWVMPGPKGPLLGNLYHGTQTFWFGLLTYGFLGTHVVSARLTHALYGAVIVLFAWLVLRRATGRPWLALAVATALATDMAFISSFRTQAYIILAGQMWLMVSFHLAVRIVQEARARAWMLLLSGTTMGLAVYGYFVFLFFLLPVALLAILGPGRAGFLRRAMLWGTGFVIGMLPYVVGYVWLAVEVGGVAQFVEWMRNAVTALKPTEGSPSYLEGLASALQNARLAVSGGGNETMMVGAPVVSGWAPWRTALLAGAVLVCLAGAAREWKRDRVMARVLLAGAALPLAYIVTAAWFGARMWAHHFTVLIAVGYLVAGLAAWWLCTLAGSRAARRFAAAAGALLLGAWLCGNMVQQQRVHDRLVATGGLGMSTDALTALSRAALTERWDTVWYFPDWGFFMPFAFLTGNRVAYEVELTPATIDRHRGIRDGVRVAFWKEEDKAGYIRTLEDNGVHDIRHYVVKSRDGRPAIHVVAGRTSVMQETATAP